MSDVGFILREERILRDASGERFVMLDRALQDSLREVGLWDFSSPCRVACCLSASTLSHWFIIRLFCCLGNFVRIVRLLDFVHVPIIGSRKSQVLRDSTPLDYDATHPQTG